VSINHQDLVKPASLETSRTDSNTLVQSHCDYLKLQAASIHEPMCTHAEVRKTANDAHVCEARAIGHDLRRDSNYARTPSSVWGCPEHHFQVPQLAERHERYADPGVPHSGQSCHDCSPWPMRTSAWIEVGFVVPGPPNGIPVTQPRIVCKDPLQRLIEREFALQTCAHADEVRAL